MEKPTVRQVADSFRAVMREWLPRDKLCRIDIINGERADGSCASHDFCDANMAMVEAWERLGYEMDSAVCDWGLPITNDAWTLVKIEGFSR